MTPRVSNYHRGFQPVPEPPHGQALALGSPVDALVGSVLPQLAKFDQHRLQTFIQCLPQQLLADEFRIVVTVQERVAPAN